MKSCTHWFGSQHHRQQWNWCLSIGFYYNSICFTSLFTFKVPWDCLSVDKSVTHYIQWGLFPNYRCEYRIAALLQASTASVRISTTFMQACNNFCNLGTHFRVSTGLTLKETRRKSLLLLPPDPVATVLGHQWHRWQRSLLLRKAAWNLGKLTDYCLFSRK